MSEPARPKKQSRKRQWGDKSRREYNSESVSRRDRVNETKRRRIEDGDELPVWADKFTEDEIRGEERRPKHKVALIFGYAGTGYHGSQIERKQKTIEGDLFRACVRAGAISKANSDDPKKVSWVRCSRTDRGVHAAANVVSAQLIVEDADIVDRINVHLPPEIRAWGFERQPKSFNAHQRCEARVYQYWIPTYCFIPPHPRSFLGSQLADIAEADGKFAEYEGRQGEAAKFWKTAEETFIAPVLLDFDEETGSRALSLIFDSNLQRQKSQTNKPEGTALNGDTAASNVTPASDVQGTKPQEDISQQPDHTQASAEPSTLDHALKSLKEAYRVARRSYRISSDQISRVRTNLKVFEGTRNYWNYTVKKSFTDASAKRYLTSCSVDESPFVVEGTEWLPLNLHGQSFMMNQIRKMVSVVAMTVRCGTSTPVMHETFKGQKLSVPKAPPTGLLLEHPVFEAYNKSLDRLQDDAVRGRIDFEKFRDEMTQFKREFIVKPMHAIEEHELVYYNFFAALDSLRSAQLLYFSTSGVSATERKIDNGENIEQVLVEDEDETGQGADE